MPRNVALASSGAVATASSTLPGWAASVAIDGDRGYTVPDYAGWWWTDNTPTFPDSIRIDFAQSETIHEIDIITAQDEFANPATPTETMTFTLYGIVNFDVEYWDGNGWVSIESITGNDLVWRKLTFSPVTTTAIRVTVNSASDDKTRIAQIEAWAEGETPVTPFTRVAFEQFGGVKFRGANIVPRPGDSGNGGFGVPANFYDLLYEWGTEGPTSAAWTEWIKPQIDAVKALGGNCIRFMFDATVRVGDADHHGVAVWRGSITAPQMASMLDQLITYLASQQMYFYATATEIRPVNAANLSTAALLSYITEYVETVSHPAYHNVIAVDVLQEANGENGVSLDNLEAAISTALTTRLTPVPVTCSCNGDRAANPATESYWGRLAAAGVDFFDYHRYWQGTANRAHLDLLIDNQWNIPVVVGETGIPHSGRFQTGPADGNSAQLSAAYYDGIVAMGSRYDVQLVAVWSSVPNETNPPDEADYGMYNIAQDGSFAFTSPRAERVSRFMQLPVTIQPREVAFDDGPELDTPPTIGSPSSVQLTWAAADGGTNVSYVPQYVELDSDGFPVGPWSNLPETTETSAMVPVAAAYRVKVKDGVTGEYRFSPWLIQ